MIIHPKIYPLEPEAVTVEFDNAIDEVVNKKVMALYVHLLANRFNGMKDVIPAYATLTIIFNASQVRKTYNVNSPLLFVTSFLEKAVDDCDWSILFQHKIIEIPVCYEETFGIDLKEMSHTLAISIDDIIRLHITKTYRVYMIGFLPGFAYMGSVDETIAYPRKHQPRKHIPAGSVGIAGKQTGIYPLGSPGGWNIIGRTPIKMFDASKENPTFLDPGNEVKFVPISRSEFDKLLSV